MHLHYGEEQGQRAATRGLHFDAAFSSFTCTFMYVSQPRLGESIFVRQWSNLTVVMSQILLV